MKYCPNCGNQTQSKFCPECGYDLQTFKAKDVQVNNNDFTTTEENELNCTPKHKKDFGKLLITTRDEIQLKKVKKNRTLFLIFEIVFTIIVFLCNIIGGIVVGLLFFIPQIKGLDKPFTVSFCDVYEHGVNGVSKGKDTYNHSFSLQYDEIKNLSSTKDGFSIYTDYTVFEVWSCVNNDEVVRFINDKIR